METTEKIVEAYVRYVRGWGTIPGVRCAGQYEIDLLAIDPVKLTRYHIETSVHGAAFAKLTAKPFDPLLLKKRVRAPAMRRTLGFFIERKFNAPEIIKRLAQFGFKRDAYRKVVVTLGWTPRPSAKRTPPRSSFGTSATSCATSPTP